MCRSIAYANQMVEEQYKLYSKSERSSLKLRRRVGRNKYMAGKLLLLNACIRKEYSRTMSIAVKLIDKLAQRYQIEEIDLTTSSLSPVDTAIYQERSSGRYDPLAIEYAKKFAGADRVVVAAPYWDMSFPALLKVFFENISINGITFENMSDGSTKGICAVSKIMLITTRGMEIEDESILDQASSYIRALCWLWGIPAYSVVSAIGMDTSDEKTRTKRLEAAIDKGLKACEDF